MSDTATVAAAPAAPAPAYKPKKVSIWRRSPSLLVGVVLVALTCLVAAFPGVFAPGDPTAMDFLAMLQPPSAEHWFGTDNYGRDIYTLVIHATRLDLLIGIGSVALPFVLGSLLGLIAGYYGGKLDAIIMRILDIFVAFPFMVLAIAIVAILGNGVMNLLIAMIAGYYGGKLDAIIMRILDIFVAFPFMVLAIAIVAILGNGVMNLLIAMWIVSWPPYTRLVRSEVLIAKNSEYVQAAKTLGYSDFSIIMRHILPNVISSSVVYAASDIVMCIMTAASMSFLGLGVPPNTPEWGAIISNGKSFITGGYWWISTSDIVMCIMTAASMSFLGLGVPPNTPEWGAIISNGKSFITGGYWWISTMPGVVMAIVGLGFSLLGDGLNDLLRTKD